MMNRIDAIEWIIMAVITGVFSITFYAAVITGVFSYKVRQVEVPAQVEIRSDLYRVLHEDTLTVNGMRIKRVYYEIK